MTKEQSAILKGIAILLMLVYHLKTIPGIEGMDGFVGQTLRQATYPISYFMYVTGYGLYIAHSQNRLTFKYLFKRSLKLYIALWMVLLIFVCGLGSWLYPGKFSLQPGTLVPCLLGWKWDYCVFLWFFLPYVLATFCTKGLYWLLDRLGIPVMLLFTMCMMFACSWLISRYLDSWLIWNTWAYIPVLTLQMLFAITVGASLAHLTLQGRSVTCNWLMGKNVLIILLLLVAVLIRGQITITVAKPFFAITVTWLVLHTNFAKPVKQVLMELGHKSMFMWLAQGFIAVEMFSEYFLKLHHPALIWLVWLAFTYVVASLLMPVHGWVTRQLRLG